MAEEALFVYTGSYLASSRSIEQAAFAIVGEEGVEKLECYDDSSVNEVCFLSGGPWCLIIGHTYRSHHAAATEEEVCFFFFGVICVRRLIDDQ